MKTHEEALKLALEALKTVRHKIDSYQVNVCDDVDEAINAAEKALAQPEEQHSCDKQEPCKTCNGTGEVETGIGMMVCDECHGTTYTTPPYVPTERQRKPLTDEQIDEIGYKVYGMKSSTDRQYARSIEAAHGIKE